MNCLMEDGSCALEGLINELIAETKDNGNLVCMTMIGTNTAYDGVVEWR